MGSQLDLADVDAVQRQRGQAAQRDLQVVLVPDGQTAQRTTENHQRDDRDFFPEQPHRRAHRVQRSRRAQKREHRHHREHRREDGIPLPGHRSPNFSAHRISFGPKAGFWPMAVFSPNSQRSTSPAEL